MTRYKWPKQVGPQWVNKMMPWIEQFWLDKKRYPSDSELVQKFGFTPQQLMQLQHSKFYKNALKARGIVLPDQSELSEAQVAVVSLVTNFTDSRSTEAKLAAVGVTVEEFNGWMRWEPFQRELAARADEMTDFFYPEAQVQLTKQIKGGNFQALKFYYEITGRAQTPEMLNMKVMVMRMQEVLIRHIQDPEVLRAIAFEMREIMKGESPVAGEVVTNGRVHNELQS